MIDQSFYARTLSMCRAHDSATEKKFHQILVKTLTKLGVKPSFDTLDNIFVTVGVSKTLFTAHVDTVHRNGGYQPVKLVDNVFQLDSLTGYCLGADDASGIFVLLSLIQAGVPGTYLFTRGEERGGVGAKHVAKDEAFLRQFDRAIAFDRRGYSDIVTHQAMGRCASDEFAEALSNQLNDLGLLYMPCDGGIYTDTAEFTHLIPECTNVSVGYFNEHSNKETQDWTYLQALVEAVKQVRWEELPTKRDPNEVEDDSWLWGGLADSGPLCDALDEWSRGSSKSLRRMVAEAVYPEDPEAAEHYVDLGLLTDDLIDEALDFGLDGVAYRLVRI